MSNINSKDTSDVTLMRWIARFISIPWAYWALAIAWFVAGNGYEEGMSLGLYVIIVFIVFLLTLGAVILAGVWGMELFGGTVLLADCLLIFVCYAVSPRLPGGLLVTLLLPPLLAGSLFLASNRISKKSKEQQV
jgi:hypothetical protein